MTYKETQQLIQKYYKKDGQNPTAYIQINKAEKTSPEYNTKMKREQYRRHRHLILDTLLNETPFTLENYEIEQIRYWIDTFNTDFKGFHRQASNETIILAFIMIQKMHSNKRIKIERYTITTKYGLTPAVFETIQNNLIFRLMQTIPLTYNQQKHLNNHIEQNKTI